MFEIVNRTEIRASPAQLWAVLSDLPEYRYWHPAIWIDGQAGPNATIEYGFKGLADLLSHPTAPARIVVYEPRLAIEWRFGIAALMRVDEWYRLTDTGPVTRVEHGLRCSGLLSWVARKRFTRTMQPLLDTSDAALKDHMGNFSHMPCRLVGAPRQVRTRPRRRC